MLEIDARLAIPDDELVERFVRSAGPGGQNVNKVASAVELRFDVRSSPSLPEPLRERLAEVIRAALVVPKKRIATKPSRASQQRRIDAKKTRSTIKRSRGRDWSGE